MVPGHSKFAGLQRFRRSLPTLLANRRSAVDVEAPVPRTFPKATVRRRQACIASPRFWNETQTSPINENRRPKHTAVYSAKAQSLAVADTLAAVSGFNSR